jgi:hypothetical protein
MKMTKTITRIEPKIPSFAEVHQELNNLVEGINAMMPNAKTPREISPAERVSEDLAKELIGHAQNILSEAQNLLRDDEIFAEHVRKEVQKRAERHATFLERLHKVRSDHEKTRTEFQEAETKPS